MASARPFRIEIESTASYLITDPGALIVAAVAGVREAEFDPNPDGPKGSRTLEEIRDAQVADIESDPTGASALSWFNGTAALAVDEVPGVERVRLSARVIAATAVGEALSRVDVAEAKTAARFAVLHAACSCGEPGCERCDDWQLTPRTAYLLYCVSQWYADGVYDDVEELGDEPVDPERHLTVLDEYPRVTWHQDAVWRRQAARAFDDLAGDLAVGRWPTPRSVGEEMALFLVLKAAPSANADDWFGGSENEEDLFKGLPDHPEDFDWGGAEEVLLQDLDFLELFDPSVDGIEDPEDDFNRAAHIGDLRPQAWFKPFANVEPRDGRRPFRR